MVSRSSPFKKSLQVGVLVLSVLAIPALSHAAFITFGLGTTNAVEGPTTYSIVYGTPITPDFYTEATATASLTLTSAPNSTATVSLGPIYTSYVSGYGTVAGVPTNLGVDLGTTTCTSTNAVATTCNFGVVTNTFGPTLFNGMEVLLTYNQTGAGSFAAWSGRVDLTAASTPEPASLLLLGLGMSGLGVRRWRQRRQ